VVAVTGSSALDTPGNGQASGRAAEPGIYVGAVIRHATLFGERPSPSGFGTWGQPVQSFFQVDDAGSWSNGHRGRLMRFLPLRGWAVFRNPYPDRHLHDAEILFLSESPVIVDAIRKSPRNVIAARQGESNPARGTKKVEPTTASTPVCVHQERPCLKKVTSLRKAL